MKRFLIAAAICALPMTASANRAAADACAASLAPEARLIFDATAPSITPTAEIRAALEEKTRDLVMNGRVSRSSARGSATAAGNCLKNLQ